MAFSYNQIITNQVTANKFHSEVTNIESIPSPSNIWLLNRLSSKEFRLPVTVVTDASASVEHNAEIANLLKRNSEHVFATNEFKNLQANVHDCNYWEIDFFQTLTNIEIVAKRNSQEVRNIKLLDILNYC